MRSHGRFTPTRFSRTNADVFNRDGHLSPTGVTSALKCESRLLRFRDRSFGSSNISSFSYETLSNQLTLVAESFGWKDTHICRMDTHSRRSFIFNGNTFAEIRIAISTRDSETRIISLTFKSTLSLVLRDVCTFLNCWLISELCIASGEVQIRVQWLIKWSGLIFHIFAWHNRNDDSPKLMLSQLSFVLRLGSRRQVRLIWRSIVWIHHRFLGDLPSEIL